MSPADSEQIARAVLCELAALPVRRVRCFIRVDPPLRGTVLPASLLRSLAGNLFYQHFPDAFVSLFEPGKPGGDKPAAFALSGPLPADGLQDLSFTITTWDPGGTLLDALLQTIEAVQAPMPDSRFRLSGFRHDPPGIGQLDVEAQYSKVPEQIDFILEGPLRLAPRRRQESGGAERTRRLLQAHETGIGEIVAASLFRLTNLSKCYGSGSFDWREFSSVDIASDCHSVKCHLSDLRCFGIKTMLERTAPKLSGVEGTIRVSAAGLALFACLVAAATLGIGKRTAEGCGACSIQPVSSSDPAQIRLSKGEN